MYVLGRAVFVDSQQLAYFEILQPHLALSEQSGSVAALACDCGLNTGDKSKESKQIQTN